MSTHRSRSYPRPLTISPHAIDRLIERHYPGMDRVRATELLRSVMQSVEFVSWSPEDLDGLGQATWRTRMIRNHSFLIVVDGTGLVRTVLP
jgi:hypothetical protein